jgi:hypothetical protein
MRCVTNDESSVRIIVEQKKKCIPFIKEKVLSSLSLAKDKTESTSFGYRRVGLKVFQQKKNNKSNRKVVFTLSTLRVPDLCQRTICSENTKTPQAPTTKEMYVKNLIKIFVSCCQKNSPIAFFFIIQFEFQTRFC